MSVKAINKATGEEIEFESDTFEQIIIAYRAAQEYEKTAKSLKDQLKLIVPGLLDEQGKSEISQEGYQFKQYPSQKKNYNKSALRAVFDEDTLDLFLEPSKGKIDSYLKEHAMAEADIIVLREGLEPVGKLSNVTRLEKVV